MNNEDFVRGGDRLPPWRAIVAATVLCCATPQPTHAQVVSQRGFVDVRGVVFPQDTAADAQNVVGDVLVREELFARLAPWFRLAGGFDARANTHDQVERSWRLDTRDRGVLRPALSIRRLSATVRNGPMTIDVGKQFIRWGKTDIVTPTDRFAPRDFINVVDGEFLPVTGVRAVGQWGTHTVDAVWVPFLTPSRLPLLDQRWSGLPPTTVPPTLVDASPALPRRTQAGIRWTHTSAGQEYSLSYVDGLNSLPDIEVVPPALLTDVSDSAMSPPAPSLVRSYPRLRSYGGDAALSLRWFTVKGEAAYITSSSVNTDDYVLYVVQLERQTGEWLLLGGYAGEVVTARRAALTVAPDVSPDRGLTRALIARAGYTLDANRSLSLEAAVRQNAHGAYVKGEFSQARGPHWRATVSVAALGGTADDFLGQYRRNSHLTGAVRYSF